MTLKEKKNTMENDKEFLNWIYERMVNVHGEKDLYDYMINFKAIIDNIGDSVADPKEEQDLKVLQDRFKNDYANEIFKQENRSLRQQLEKREESIKELLDVTIIAGNHRVKDIVSRAKALLDKQ